MRHCLATVFTAAILAGGFFTSSVQAQNSQNATSAVQVSVSLRPLVSISTIDALDFSDLFGALFDQGFLTTGNDGQFVFTPQLTPTVPLPTTGQVGVAGSGGGAFDIACDVETLLAETPDFFSLELSISQGIAGAVNPCSGLNDPVLSVSPAGPNTPLSVGGQINLPDSVTTFSASDIDALQREVTATLLAVFQ